MNSPNPNALRRSGLFYSFHIATHCENLNSVTLALIFLQVDRKCVYDLSLLFRVLLEQRYHQKFKARLYLYSKDGERWLNTPCLVPTNIGRSGTPSPSNFDRYKFLTDCHYFNGQTSSRLSQKLCDGPSSLCKLRGGTDFLV